MPDRLQRIFEWPLWSWRNLSTTVVGLLIVFALVGKASTALSSEPAPPSGVASAPATAAPTVTSEPMPDPTGVPKGVPSTPVPTAASSSLPVPAATQGEACQTVAGRFVAAWARPSLPGAEWLDGIRNYATSAFLVQLAKSDPAHVPATKVLGHPGAVSASGTTATFRVVTDGGGVDVTTELRGGSCRVSDLQPADGGVPGAPTPVLTATPGGG